MDGYRIHRWNGELVWESMAEPNPGPDEVVVEVEACGIGLTVLNCIAGNLADERASLPRVPGHELVGRVTEAGENASRELVGRRVVAYFYLFCGSCRACRDGREQRCADLAGWIGVHTDGGYAPRTALPARNVVAVSEDLDPVWGTVVPDAVATPIHVTHRAGIGPDDRVAVIGAGGGVGAHMVQVARLAGSEVAGLEVGEDKLALVADLGAFPVASPDFTQLSSDVVNGRPPTVVVDFVGTEGSLAWGGRALSQGGRFVALTTFPGRSWDLSPRQLVFGELAFLGSRYATRDEVSEAAEMVTTGRVRPVIGRVVGPGEISSVHDDLRRGELSGRGAVDWRLD